MALDAVLYLVGGDEVDVLARASCGLIETIEHQVDGAARAAQRGEGGALTAAAGSRDDWERGRAVPPQAIGGGGCGTWTAKRLPMKSASLTLQASAIIQPLYIGAC